MSAAEPRSSAIRARVLELTRARGPEKSICPSEVARSLEPDCWRDLLHEVRVVSQALVDEGLLEATQGGRVVDLPTARGPVRLRMRPADHAGD
jgi:hypothetical protein